MNQKDVWKKYITAQSKILEYKSKPIGVDTTKSVHISGLNLCLTIDQEIFKQVFKEEVEKVFNISDFDFESGYIQTSVTNTTNITSEHLKELKDLAEICYIDFNENPVIEGVITEHNNNIRDELKNTIGELQSKYDSKNKEAIHLTIDEWNKAKAIRGVKFGKRGTARFNIKPSAKFISEKIFHHQYFLEDYDTLATNEELPENVFNYLNSNLNFKIKSVKITLTTTLSNGSEILQNIRTALKEKTNFYPYCFEDVLTVILEKKKIRKAGFDTFKSAIENINEFIIKNFNDCEISISTTFFYSYDETVNITFFDKFLDTYRNNYELQFLELKSKSQFRIDRSFDSIYFDFETEEELNEKINLINSFSFFDIYYRGKRQEFKFNIVIETGLHELQSKLKKDIPKLNTKLIANGEKLLFRQFYKAGDGNKGFERDKLNDQLNDFINIETFRYVINDTFQEKYLCEENFELKVEQEEEKLSKLLREEFYFGNPQKEKFYLGKLQKVDYPDLYFVVDEERIEEVKENITKENVKAIFPDLKGEKDKIKRLEDTVLKLDDEKTKLPNDNAKVFLYDSSKAKIIENIDYLLNKTTAEWQDFENNLFSKSLNESQRQAIFKSLYADELALIQGPPGTGKSTAIAEIIWQHIRKDPKQKILLTSETNLAVDNAIDRLKNGENNVVKPIRFGNTDNLESEGYFYSLVAIENWQKSDSNEYNTVSHWVNNIANRVKYQTDELIDSLLDRWKKHLQKPSNETKTLFADKYLEYVNLIGATGSSMGKLNSENKWTSFFRSYLNVFNLKSYQENDYKSCDRTNINFDTIIMDEASKATPPELALPVLFGKKSIIVGDHRQLPPMIDGNEIKETLKSTGDKEALELAELFSQKDFQTSQFERLFTNIHESIKGTFDTQYRMHPAINNVIAQFYEKDGGLKCGLPLEETFHSSFENEASRYHGLHYKNILTPETHTIWVNVTTSEIQEGTSRVNFGEIEAINNILKVLKNCKGKNEFGQWLSNQSQEEKQIGMISFYGKQINYLERMLIESHNDLYFGKGKDNDKKNLIRLSTVDRFQGMERNIIIASMVRSNKIASFPGQEADFELYPALGYPNQESLGFAESPNRLNVALSRARRLLIVVGNIEHFCRKDIYKKVFETIQQNGKIISAEELQNAVEQNG
jgi:superfamily I DNA and/or RNA helicase